MDSVITKILVFGGLAVVFLILFLIFYGSISVVESVLPDKIFSKSGFIFVICFSGLLFYIVFDHINMSEDISKMRIENLVRKIDHMERHLFAIEKEIEKLRTHHEI